MPEVDQKPEKLYLIYNVIPRSIFQYAHVRRAWITIRHYARQTYSFGPMFLPVIPYFGESRSVDHSQNITIELSAYLDPIYRAKIMDLPNLIIETPDGRILKPRSAKESVTGISSKEFVYDALVESTPWFIIQEANIKLDGDNVLKVPRMRFEFTSEFVINWNEPIAP